MLTLSSRCTVLLALKQRMIALNHFKDFQRAQVDINLTFHLASLEGKLWDLAEGTENDVLCAFLYRKGSLLNFISRYSTV